MAVERQSFEYIKKNIGDVPTLKEAIANAYNADISINTKLKQMEKEIFEKMKNDNKAKGYELKVFQDLLQGKTKVEQLSIRAKNDNEKNDGVER